MTGVLVAPLGLGPLRLAAVVCHVRPRRLVCVVSPGSAYRAGALRGLLAGVGRATGVRPVVVDEVAPDRARLRAALDAATDGDVVALDVSGGTKPMALAVLDWWADLPPRRRGTRWVVDTHGQVLVDADGRTVPAAVPTPDLPLLARLHDVLEVSGRRAAWSEQDVRAGLRLLDGGGGATPEERGRQLEAAVASAAARTCGGTVWQGVEALLRDPDDCTVPALDRSGRARRFELDVVRQDGHRTWVLEVKHRRLTAADAHEHLAEVVRRARQLGGPEAGAGLVFLREGTARRAEGSASLLTGPRPRLFGRADIGDLLAAALGEAPRERSALVRWLTA